MKETKLFFIFISFFVFNKTFAMEEDAKQSKVEANQALALAIRDGDVQGVLLALEQGADANVMSTKHVAGVLWGGYVECPGMIAAIELADDKAVPIIRALLQYSADPNVTYNKNGCSPLHLAAPRQKLELVKLLVKYGASLSLQNKDLMTPLHSAVTTDDMETVEAMLTVPKDTMKLPCLFTLLCCFKRWQNNKTRTIPKDIRLMLCRYALRAGVDVDSAVDVHLKVLQASLEIRWNDLTPRLMVVWRRDCLASKNYEYQTMTDEQYKKELSNLKAIEALLNPGNDVARRKVMQTAVYNEFKNKIPGVN